MTTPTIFPRVCCIFNLGAAYRWPIYNAMATHFDCDFYLGDQGKTPVKIFDYTALQGFRDTLHNVFYGNFYRQSGSVKLVFKPYDTYILDGEPYCLSTWAILLLSKIFHKRTIAWTHGWYGKETCVKRWLKKAFYSMFDHLLLYNEYAIQLMVKEGFDYNKMTCIANSLDSDKEKQIRLHLKATDVYSRHFGNNHPTLIYCGRLQKRKRLDLILKAMAQLRDAGTIVNAVFVGEEIEDIKLPDTIRSLSLDAQCWIFGACYDDNTLGELFYNAHACVSPGNVGLTAIHSLTFGCPVITHGNLPYQGPEFEAITPGITGDFFEENNIEDLQKTIAKWTKVTPEQRNHTRQNAFKEVDCKWNIHYQLDVLHRILRFHKTFDTQILERSQTSSINTIKKD